MTKQEFWTADNVSSFNGHTVSGGEVELTDSEYEEVLNDIYGDVEVCGMKYGAGAILVDVDPTAFRCGKSDYESGIQTELEDQLDREDSSGIEFIDGDEYDLDSEDDEEEESDDE